MDNLTDFSEVKTKFSDSKETKQRTAEHIRYKRKENMSCLIPTRRFWFTRVADRVDKLDIYVL